MSVFGNVKSVLPPSDTFLSDIVNGLQVSVFGHPIVKQFPCLRFGWLEDMDIDRDKNRI